MRNVKERRQKRRVAGSHSALSGCFYPVITSLSAGRAIKTQEIEQQLHLQQHTSLATLYWSTEKRESTQREKEQWKRREMRERKCERDKDTDRKTENKKKIKL